MTQQVPTIGRLVHYTLTAADAGAVNAQDGKKNLAAEGDVYPALIVRVFGDRPESAVNLRVFYDGDGSYWATSRLQGDGPCRWAWPPRVG